MRKEKVLTGGLVSLFIVSACLPTGQVHWLLNDQPVFGPGPSGVWDNGSIIGFCVVRNGDRYVAYYDSGAVGIGRATSSDGLVWQRDPTTPVLARGPDLYDAKYIWGPAVVADPDGYKMWYTSSDPDNTWTISLAVSHDGVEWVKCPSNPVLRVDLPDKVGDPWVIWEDGLYKMWYTHYNRSLGHFVIDYATSPDGVEWRKCERNPVLAPSKSGPDSSSVRDPCVIRTDNGYGMWYRGHRIDAEKLDYMLCVIHRWCHLDEARGKPSAGRSGRHLALQTLVSESGKGAGWVFDVVYLPGQRRGRVRILPDI